MIMTKGRPFWVLVRQVNQMANIVKDRVTDPDQSQQATEYPYPLASPRFRLYDALHWENHTISQLFKTQDLVSLHSSRFNQN